MFSSRIRVAESVIWKIYWSSLWCHLRELEDRGRTDMKTVKYHSTLAKNKMHYLQCCNFISFHFSDDLKRPNFWRQKQQQTFWAPQRMFLHLTNEKRYNNSYYYLTYYIILLYTFMYCVMYFYYINKHYIYILIYKY